MRVRQGTATLSATDVANHLSCRHLTTLNLRLAKGEIAEPSWENPHLRVIQQRGLDHEKAYIESLRSKGLRRLCSQPSWRRRAGPLPGGHRFGRRLIPGNKALQRVPIEPFVPKTPEKGIFVWQSVGPFKPYFNRDKYATSRTADRVTAAQSPRSRKR